MCVFILHIVGKTGIVIYFEILSFLSPSEFLCGLRHIGNVPPFGCFFIRSLTLLSDVRGGFWCLSNSNSKERFCPV